MTIKFLLKFYKFYELENTLLLGQKFLNNLKLVFTVYFFNGHGTSGTGVTLRHESENNACVFKQIQVSPLETLASSAETTGFAEGRQHPFISVVMNGTWPEFTHEIAKWIGHWSNLIMD